MKKTGENIAARLTKKKLKTLIHDPLKSAEAVKLHYVSDKDKGIVRIKSGGGFTYKALGKEITDAVTLDRIKGLVIPPAWTDVWICALPNGHLQATGFDTKNRKQYRYHPMWNALRGQTKFVHMGDFGAVLPEIRRKVNADLALDGLPMKKVLATLVSLIDHTGIRVGCNMYEKMYGSFGLTTLKNRHVKINGTEATFTFTGKKGVPQHILLRSKKLAKIISQCRDIPGKELFQYLDENGDRKQVDSGMVNEYIKAVSGKEFTAKDFRTWIGTLSAVEAFKDAVAYDSDADIKKKIVEVVDIVAGRLGNTRTVCKKYYIHPAVIDHYSKGTIAKFFESSQTGSVSGLSTEEIALLKMIDNERDAVITTVQL